MLIKPPKQIIILYLLIFSSPVLLAQSLYFPPGDGPWEERTSQEVGLNPTKLQTAIEFAQANEYSMMTSQKKHHINYTRENGN